MVAANKSVIAPYFMRRSANGLCNAGPTNPICLMTFVDGNVCRLSLPYLWLVDYDLGSRHLEVNRCTI
jgi:hypothetical protein